MKVRSGTAPYSHDYGECPGRRLTSPGIAETFGYEPIRGRIARPEPTPEPALSWTLEAQRNRVRRELRG